MAAPTDKQVAALRAQLAGDAREHRRLLDEFTSGEDTVRYSVLLTGALITAMERRFGANPRPTTVAKFVDELRNRSTDIAEQLSPEVGERVMMAASGSDSVDHLDDATKTWAKIVLTVGLVRDEKLADPGLDAFLAEARGVAETLG